MPVIRVMLGETEVNRFTFDREIISVGRARDNDVVVENLAVSRNHARIRRSEDGRYTLSDLNSANGTFVNGVQVTKIEIKDGDSIAIGKHNLIFNDTQPSDEEVIGDAFGADRTVVVERIPDARLQVIKGKQQGQEIKVAAIETTMGRSSDNDVRIHDWFASKRHATILRQGTKYFIQDAGSWKGTLVNGQRVQEAPLSPNDIIKIGSTVFRFAVKSGDMETADIPGAVGARDVRPGESGPAPTPSPDGPAPDAYVAEQTEVEPDSEEAAMEAGGPDAEAEAPAAVYADAPEGAPLSREEDPDGTMPPPDVPTAAEVIAASQVAPEMESDASETTDNFAGPQEDEPAEETVELGSDGEQPDLMAEVDAMLGEDDEAAEDGDDVSVFDLGEPSDDATPGFGPDEPVFAEAEAMEPEEPVGAELPIDAEQPADEAVVADWAADTDELAAPEHEQAPAEAPEAATDEEKAAHEIQMWERALQNRSPLVRKEAARMLKKLTGKDYDV